MTLIASLFEPFSENGAFFVRIVWGFTLLAGLALAKVAYDRFLPLKPTSTEALADASEPIPEDE